ncbi:hypothetical protein ON010_g10029 [Phytophthora cinnamomi]|nr:hypothetical protein ON010_g10029 [Phytophthora cinnamomi]
MGAGASAQCSCFTWTPPVSPPILNVKQTTDSICLGLQVVFEIDVALPGTPLPSGMAEMNLPTADHLILSTHTSSSSAGFLHRLPLVLLKRMLLELLGNRRTAPLQQQPVSQSNSELVIVVPSTTSYSPLQLFVTSSSSVRQCVHVLFEIANDDAKQDYLLAFSLLLCPQFPTNTIQTRPFYHLQLGLRDAKSAETFEVKIYGHNVQRPIVEKPYIVFKMELCLGDLTWRVARRYREFAELHARLNMVVQECTLPVLPPTKWFAATEHNFLVQRQRLLENYLKGVSMVDELQDSVPLLVFLGVLSASYVNHVALRRHRRQILHLQILEYYTQPGDLILFNGRAKLTRAEWDHVAVVVPSRDKGHLQLLEATGDGVTLSPLTTHDFFADFAIASIFDLPRPVAQAYKALGIISGSVEANDFWPGSFSPGDFVDAELGRHGASLSPEVIIDCKLLEVATATKRTQSTLN